MSTSLRALPATHLASAIVLRTLVLAVIWWILVEGRSGYAGYGVVAVPVATVCSLLLVTPGPPPALVARFVGGVRLLGWVVGQAVRGGVDVSRRALARPVDVDPREVTADLSLPPGLARGLAIGLMGLLPGSLIQGVSDDHVTIHALTPDIDTAAQFETLQRHVAAATGVPLTPRG